MAQQYATRLIASVGGLNAMTILQRVMTAEGLARSNLMVCGAVCAAAPFVVWAFVSRFGWKGAAWASVVYNSLYVFLQVPVMVRAGRLRSVFRPRWKEALRTDGILEYLRLAVPGLVFICLEWWSLELLMVLGGTRPSAETVVGALAICLNLETVFELCWLGLAVGVSVCVGKAVGHADPLAARGAAKVGLLLAFGGGAVVAAGLVLGGASFAATLFSTRSKNDRPIARLVGKSAPALALMVWSDALNTTVQGALAGAGKPQAIAISNFVSWYGVGAPVAFFSVYYLQLDQAAVPALLACGADRLGFGDPRRFAASVDRDGRR
ncbi:hypothetical protein CTAYLR_003802 [Chrysophaeum taylorii]|uniref:Protein DETOXIFICATION n=1 Tax=Chrysophaeum taylorii TaxID=2483200 RepID=A0AAD7UDU1_9STRA|nr:hypothetical protein CTAYLR_003802 [Chrysophaeum taylorii]